MTEPKKIIIAMGFMVPLFSLGGLFWYTFLTPLAICTDKGGMYVKESHSCVCSSQEGLFVCYGSETEATAELIEKMYEDRPKEN